MLSLAEEEEMKLNDSKFHLCIFCANSFKSAQALSLHERVKHLNELSSKRRRTYTLKFKVKVIEKVLLNRTNGVSDDAAGLEFNIDTSLVSKWMKDKDKIVAAAAEGRKRESRVKIRGSNIKSKYSELYALLDQEMGPPAKLSKGATAPTFSTIWARAKQIYKALTGNPDANLGKHAVHSYLVRRKVQLQKKRKKRKPNAKKGGADAVAAADGSLGVDAHLMPPHNGQLPLPPGMQMISFGGENGGAVAAAGGATIVYQSRDETDVYRPPETVRYSNVPQQQQQQQHFEARPAPQDLSQTTYVVSPPTQHVYSPTSADQVGSQHQQQQLQQQQEHASSIADSCELSNEAHDVTQQSNGDHSMGESRDLEEVAPVQPEKGEGGEGGGEEGAGNGESAAKDGEVPAKKVKLTKGKDKRQTYPLRFKVEVIEKAEVNEEDGVSHHDTAKYFNIPASLLSKWMKDKNKILTAAWESPHKIEASKIRKATKHQELYSLLDEEVRVARHNGSSVGFNLLWLKATEIHRHLTKNPTAHLGKHVVTLYLQRDKVNPKPPSKKKKKGSKGSAALDGASGLPKLLPLPPSYYSHGVGSRLQPHLGGPLALPPTEMQKKKVKKVKAPKGHFAKKSAAPSIKVEPRTEDDEENPPEESGGGGVSPPSQNIGCAEESMIAAAAAAEAAANDGVTFLCLYCASTFETATLLVSHEQEVHGIEPLAAAAREEKLQKGDDDVGAVNLEDPDFQWPEDDDDQDEKPFAHFGFDQGSDGMENDELLAAADVKEDVAGDAPKPNFAKRADGKRRTYPLRFKVKVIERVEMNRYDGYDDDDVAQEFGLEPATVAKWMKHKVKILTQYDNKHGFFLPEHHLNDTTAVSSAGAATIKVERAAAGEDTAAAEEFDVKPFLNVDWGDMDESGVGGYDDFDADIDDKSLIKKIKQTKGSFKRTQYTLKFKANVVSKVERYKAEGLGFDFAAQQFSINRCMISKWFKEKDKIMRLYEAKFGEFVPEEPPPPPPNPDGGEGGEGGEGGNTEGKTPEQIALAAKEARRYLCLYCAQPFKTSQALSVHEKYKHTNKPPEDLVKKEPKKRGRKKKVRPEGGAANEDGTPAKPKVKFTKGRSRRHTYTLRYKMKAIEKVEINRKAGVSDEASSREFNVSTSLISKWIKDKEKITNAVATMKTKNKELVKIRPRTKPPKQPSDKRKKPRKKKEKGGGGGGANPAAGAAVVPAAGQLHANPQPGASVVAGAVIPAGVSIIRQSNEPKGDVRKELQAHVHPTHYYVGAPYGLYVP